MKILSVLLFSIGLHALLAAANQKKSSEDVYEVEYEYEYEYEDQDQEQDQVVEEEVEIGGTSKENIPFIKYGFIKNVGGGIIKISKPLLDELYLNETADVYDCVKKVDARILMIEEDEEEDDTPDLAQQVNDLRMKMEQAASLASNMAADGNSPNTTSTTTEDQNAKNDTTDNSASTTNTETTIPEAPKKRISFREKQEQKMVERRAREAEREKLRPKFRLGADCESLICGSCKAIVEEFGSAVHQAASNTSVRYIEEVTEGLCDRKEIKLKYVDMVGDICTKFEMESTGYKEALMQPFEEDDRWSQLLVPEILNPKIQKTCVGIGACNDQQFKFVSEPVVNTQEHWDEKCFVCQAFAHNLEERMQLSRHVTEKSIVPMVASTCNRLTLDPHYRKVCEPLTKGKLLDDIAWLAKIHGERVIQRFRGEQAFEDRLCEEIDWCTPWVDPETLREKEAKQTMEEVFF